MPEASWINLAIQIPIVLLFAYVMLKMSAMFLTHLKEEEDRSREFIKEQRADHNRAVETLSIKIGAALDALTDRMCTQFDAIARQMDRSYGLEIGHDAFVRTSFRERFGPLVISAAEKAAEDATKGSR